VSNNRKAPALSAAAAAGVPTLWLPTKDAPETADAELAAALQRAAADLVICQTGCISHNAYWRVKDFCKRTGKQCVFVENPSTSSLTRTLQQITAGDSAEKPAADAGR